MSDILIESVLQEQRQFPPPAGFRAQARISSLEQYQQLCEQFQRDPQGFWEGLAERELHWFGRWEQVLDWQPPQVRWFVGGQINLSYNCLDRHLDTPRRTKPAIIWQGEPGEVRVITYEQLHHDVCQMANALKALGVAGAGTQPDVSVFAVAMAGACLGFLVHNHHPARVFMGDTGSLALGGGRWQALALSPNSCGYCWF